MNVTACGSLFCSKYFKIAVMHRDSINIVNHTVNNYSLNVNVGVTLGGRGVYVPPPAKQAAVSWIFNF